MLMRTTSDFVGPCRNVERVDVLAAKDTKCRICSRVEVEMGRSSPCTTVFKPPAFVWLSATSPKKPFQSFRRMVQ